MKTQLIKRVLLFISLVTIFSMSSCGNPMDEIAGSYELDKATVKAALQAEIDLQAESSDGPVDAFGATMAMGMIDAMSMTLTLNADGTASSTMSAMGQTKSASGTWTYENEKVSITLSEEGETPDTATGVYAQDSIRMNFEGEEKLPFELVFKKLAS